MLWLALHLPLLPLEVFTRGGQSPSNAQAIAITSSVESSATVVAVNRPAQACGVIAGMSVSVACALASNLHTLARDVAKENATLSRIAAWSLQFTSFVSIAVSGEILLEIEGSLKLFGGLTRLHQHITRSVADLARMLHKQCDLNRLVRPPFRICIDSAGLNVHLLPDPFSS